MYPYIRAPLALAFALLVSHSLADTVNGDGCPGVLNVGSDSSSTCCVGGQLTLSVCSGWPICQGPTTVTQTAISCATILYPASASYSALVSAASSSLAASGTNYQTAIPYAAADTGAGATDTGATQTQTAASTDAGSSQTQAAATTSAPASASASSSGNGAVGSQEKMKWVAGAAAGLVAAAAAIA